MKLISAVIKPFKLEDVRQALAEAGVQGMRSIGPGGHAASASVPELD